jgi:hypothetical protein
MASTVGQHDDPLKRGGRRGRNGQAPHVLSYVWSTPRPASWRPGHLVVYYAAGWGTLVGIVVLTGDSVQLGEGQWGLRAPICPCCSLTHRRRPYWPTPASRRRERMSALDAAEYAQVRDLMGRGGSNLVVVSVRLSRDRHSAIGRPQPARRR